MKRFWAFTAVFNSSTHWIFRASFFPAEKPTETAQSGRLSSAHTAFLMKNCQLLATQHT